MSENQGRPAAHATLDGSRRGGVAVPPDSTGQQRRPRPSPAPDLPGREQRQFRLLVRDSRRRLLQSLAFSRDADPLQFLLWGLALAMMPPLVTSVSRMLRYNAISPLATPDAIARLVLHDRLFFVIYGMLAAALLAALLWDALFPDRADQEIIGVLPVRPRTLAAARLASSVGTALAFAATLSVPAGFFYGFAQLALPGASGWWLRLVAGHVIATMAASTFVFLALMAFRALIAISAGERIAARVAVALQLLTVVSFVEVFLFLPGVLAALTRQMQSGLSGSSPLPLVWFGSLYAWLADGQSAWLGMAATAAIATVGAAAAVILLSLVPAAWIGRRVLETSTRERAGGLMIVGRAIARLSIGSPAVRGMFLFALASLMRSRRHALVLATYLGLATALSVVQLISAFYSRRGLVLDTPGVVLLQVPMVLVFFAAFGLRSAFAIPTDVDANWPFRLAAPTARQTVSVTRRLMLTLGIVPITVIWLTVTATLWPLRDAVIAALFVLVSGLALVEFAVGNWTKVPFASAHEPATVTMRSRWPFFVFALHMFGFILAAVQREALRSTTATLWYLGIGLAITVALRLRREHNLRRETPTFDAVDGERLEVLNLSEASS